MKKYNIYVSYLAEKDLEEIVLYIQNKLYAPKVALEFLGGFELFIENLSVMPFKNPLVKDKRLALKGYRFYIIDNYLIFYIINEKELCVDIHRILYSRRNWMSIL